jgi:DNA ligase-1
MTRQGKEYKGLDHIVADLQKLVGTDTFVDGELVYKNKEGLSDSAAFQVGTGLAMSKSDDKSELKLVIFDIFPLEEFWSGKSKETYSQRHKRLKELEVEIVMEELEENLEVVEMFYDGYDHSEIWKWLDYAEEHDYEGCIINLDDCYECKRTKSLLKVKKFKEIDLRCTGVNIATSGKYKGFLGSITCKYGDSTVDVGSGFDDSTRQYYTDNPNEIIGKVISIKYKEETVNKNGGKSLQFPVLVAVREESDKSFADDEVEV